LVRRIAMKKLGGGIRSFVRDEDGATMVEYGLMVALIAVVVAVAAKVLGSDISTLFTNVSTTVSG
jgi:pilus assembly protein Flp/PilA